MFLTSLYINIHNVKYTKTVSLQILAFLLLLFFFGNITAQKKISYSDQYWMQYYGHLQLSSRWTMAADGGLRMKKALSEKAATLGRIGIQYNISQNFSAAIGGAYFSQYINDKISREEWRGYQELFYKHRLKRLSVSYRFRLEERYFHSLTTGKDNFNFRPRFRAYFTIPLNHMNMADKTVYLIVGDEIFMNFGDGVIYNYDQNRLISGIGYKLNNAFSIYATYVYQFAQRSAISFEHSDIIWLGISHTIKLKKKEEVKN